MSKPTALLQGTLYLLILKILDVEPRSGWSISQRLWQMSNETLQVSHGSLYLRCTSSSTKAGFKANGGHRTPDAPSSCIP